MSNPITAALLFAAPLVVVAIFWLIAWRERSTRTDPGAEGFVARNGPVIASYLVVAVGFWVLFMIVWPLLYMVDYSFHPKLPPARRGGPQDVYTLENYWYFVYGSTRVFTSFNWVHINAFWQTIVVSVLVTIANFAICYPLAYYMAQVARPAKLRALLLLLIVPYWVNEILRAFAFLVLFGTGGTINRILQALGLVETPIDFIGLNVALYAGLTYAYLLLMIFPLYNAIESLDHNQIEAARDLGAPWWHIHVNVVMPFAKPGIASGCTLVFMLSAGSLAAPLVLGGPKTLWFTPIVYDRFYQAFNWQQGSAYAIILLLTCIVFVMAVMRVFKVSLSEITR